MTLKFLFVVFMCLNLLNNVDHGILPAGSLMIKDDLDLNNFQFGLIGSSVFAGLTVGKSVTLLRVKLYRVRRCHLRVLSFRYEADPDVDLDR